MIKILLMVVGFFMVSFIFSMLFGKMIKRCGEGNPSNLEERKEG